ncbi:MAG: serine/threonine protein phosphatase, partial [Planctomycetes bacterium]|nr:serine/threonine protein phosphatase [Planctomycetota bacterium]
HEVLMLGAKEGGRDDIGFWLRCGGLNALQSYTTVGKEPTLEDIPDAHWHFVKHTCVDWFEAEEHFFVHANVDPRRPLDKQIVQDLHWRNLNKTEHVPHCSGKKMICGHTQQRSGVPLNLESAVCIDTWAYGGGWLTCLDVVGGNYWQANELGETRVGKLNGG